ncbi:MAG: hypothetical protein NTY80_01310 [candidate division SR1 bacterium]|nr:hypothetical protein [candidate division SR1 bacterium]
MKKFLSVLFFSGFLYIGNIALGSGTGDSFINTQIDGRVFNQANSEVQNIEVKFCENDSKTKKYIITAGQQQDICLEISNSMDKDILVSMSFVDGALTNDQWKNRACLGNDQKEKFGQYVTGIENSFIVPANVNIIKHAQLLYPQTAKGDVLGCLVYYTKGVSLGGVVDFSILIRRAKFLDIIIAEPYLSVHRKEIMLLSIGILCILLLMGRKIYRYRKYKT